MSYIVSHNIPNKRCRIHFSDCKSLKQVIGDKKTDNQKYSKVLDTCHDVNEYLKNNTSMDCSCCQHCKPSCCDDK